LNYLIGIGGVFLVQLAISYTVILAGTGNGSFVGLGAMLFALIGIPGTVIANFLIIRQYRKTPKQSSVISLISVSLLLPIAQLALLFAQQVFNL
jgi:hypothetical protein